MTMLQSDDPSGCAHRFAGRCLMVGFEGPSLDPAERRALRELSPGGVILFRRNLTSPQGLADLIGELRELLPGPRLFAIDQEGGRVSRLEPWLGATPTAAALASAGTGAIRRFGEATGEALRALGLNLDLAPVVDLSAPIAANGIGDRAFGTDPGWVALRAGEFLDGLQSRGVAGCLKHFPGHGEARVDAHLARPRVERSARELERDELEPFRLLGPRAPLIMVGHGHFPALDSEGDRPSCLSARVVGGWLRGRLGYSGLVATDDLEMGAVTDFMAGGEDAILALSSGCDLLLYCRDLERASRALDAIERTAELDSGFADRVRTAAHRVERTAANWPLTPPDPIAWSRALAVMTTTSWLA